MNPKKRAILVSLGIISLALLFIVPIWIQEIVYRQKAFTTFRLIEYRLTQDVSSYLTTQKLFSHFSTFHRGKSRDAAEFLNPRVPWKNTRGRTFYLPSLKSVPKIPLQHSLPIEAFEWKNAHHFDYGILDFSILQELRPYDHWDISSALPTLEALDGISLGFLSTELFFSATPSPNFDVLVQFAKLRLLWGIQNNDIVSGLKDVRRLAHLCYSTETTRGLQAAIDILTIEYEAYYYAIKERILRPEKWRPIAEPNQIMLGLGQTHGLYSLLSPPKLLTQTIGNPKNHVGRCAIIAKGMDRIAKIRPYIDTVSFPFERRFDNQLAALQQLATDPNNGCRLPYVRAYWDGTLVAPKSSDDPWWARMMKPFPYLRRAAAILLLANAAR